MLHRPLVKSSNETCKLKIYISRLCQCPRCPWIGIKDMCLTPTNSFPRIITGQIHMFVNNFDYCNFVTSLNTMFNLYEMLENILMKLKHHKYQLINVVFGPVQAPVPLSIFRSNSKFDENSKHSSSKHSSMIGPVYSKLKRSEFSSNFKFDRNMLSGTGAWCSI